MCKYNTFNSIPDKSVIARLKKNINFLDHEVFGLEVGKEYEVFGIIFRDNVPWFYVCEEDSDDYPIPFSADLFDVVINDFPREWQLNYKSIDGIQKCEIVFPEWARDAMFYEKLVEGASNEAEIFNKYKKNLEKTGIG